MARPIQLTAALEMDPIEGSGWMDISRLRDRLETRLGMEERFIIEARERGEDVTGREAEWIRTLRRYERLCDRIVRQPAA